jgi:hypothetical protein
MNGGSIINSINKVYITNAGTTSSISHAQTAKNYAIFTLVNTTINTSRTYYFDQSTYQIGQIIYFYNLIKQSTATCFILQGDSGNQYPTQQFFVSSTVYTSLLLSDFESLQLIYVGSNSWVGRFCFDYPEAITVRTSFTSPSPNTPSNSTIPTFPDVVYY